MNGTGNTQLKRPTRRQGNSLDSRADTRAILIVDLKEGLEI